MTDRGAETSLTSRTVELGGCCVVEVAGELDLSTADKLWEAVSEVLSSRDLPLVLDLGELRFCDSAGLAVLVRTHNALQARGHGLVVARPAPIVTRILELSGLNQAVIAAADLDEACAIAAAPADT
jgi:anti-anti-sigma factor